MRTGVTLQACNPVLRYCSLGSLRLVYFSLLPEVTGHSQHEANVSETARSTLSFPTEVPVSGTPQRKQQRKCFSFLSRLLLAGSIDISQSDFYVSFHFIPTTQAPGSAC